VKSWRYTAFTAKGRQKNGVILAETRQRATDLLRADGLFPSEISPRAPSIGSGLRKSRISDDMRTIFTRQMAVMLAAELPADAALSAVRDGGAGARFDGFVADCMAEVLEGRPLSEALSSADPGLPRYYAAAVQAGETSGDLGRVFESLAAYLETASAERNQIATALIYPGFVAAISIIVCAVLMTTVAPEIVAMFAVTGRELPALTQTMLGISGWIGDRWPILLVVGLLATGGFVLGLRQPAFRGAWHGFLLFLPVLGRLIRLGAAAQYLRTLALIVGSRQTVLQAAENAANVMGIARFRHEADRTSEALRAGEALGEALSHLSVIPPVARQLLSAGESSARLGIMCERAATLVENRLANDRKRFAALLDPMLMMLVGVMVLVIVLSVLLPIFDLQSVIAP